LVYIMVQNMLLVWLKPTNKSTQEDYTTSVNWFPNLGLSPRIQTVTNCL